MKKPKDATPMVKGHREEYLIRFIRENSDEKGELVFTRARELIFMKKTGLKARQSFTRLLKKIEGRGVIKRGSHEGIIGKRVIQLAVLEKFEDSTTVPVFGVASKISQKIIERQIQLKKAEEALQLLLNLGFIS